MTARKAEETTTRTRLLEAAMRLFAERGYDRTTVGEIERAAGLAPRSGALYQYFSGKEELLHAALELELRAVDELDSVMEALPLGDLRAELTLLARWNLASLSRRQSLRRFLARDAERLPLALTSELYDRLVTRPYDQIVQVVERRLASPDASPLDVEALAVIFVQAMSGYRDMEATFSRVYADVDDERFVRSWVEAVLAVARDAGLEPDRPPPEDRTLRGHRDAASER